MQLSASALLWWEPLQLPLLGGADRSLLSRGLPPQTSSSASEPNATRYAGHLNQRSWGPSTQRHMPTYARPTQRRLRPTHPACQFWMKPFRLTISNWRASQRNPPHSPYRPRRAHKPRAWKWRWIARPQSKLPMCIPLVGSPRGHPDSRHSLSHKSLQHPPVRPLPPSGSATLLLHPRHQSRTPHKLSSSRSWGLPL